MALRDEIFEQQDSINTLLEKQDDPIRSIAKCLQVFQSGFRLSLQLSPPIIQLSLDADKRD